MDLLQEAIVTQAELMELTCDPVGQVEGHIVEARVDPKRGSVSSGTLGPWACFSLKELVF